MSGSREREREREREGGGGGGAGGLGGGNVCMYSNENCVNVVCIQYFIIIG